MELSGGEEARSTARIPVSSGQSSSPLGMKVTTSEFRTMARAESTDSQRSTRSGGGSPASVK